MWTVNAETTITSTSHFSCFPYLLGHAQSHINILILLSESGLSLLPFRPCMHEEEAVTPPPIWGGAVAPSPAAPLTCSTHLLHSPAPLTCVSASHQAVRCRQAQASLPQTTQTTGQASPPKASGQAYRHQAPRHCHQAPHSQSSCSFASGCRSVYMAGWGGRVLKR